MREIKFRAWDASIPTFEEAMEEKQATGQMVNWEYVRESAYFLDGIKGEYPIMQYTGLKDKNGVEIYEGDIVSSGRGKGMAVIYQAPKFVMKEKIKSGFSKCWSEFILSPDQNQFEEVIGNIYESPELLEQKNA